jgi:hypothetical protein
MTVGWGGSENQKTASTPFPPPLEIAGAISTFPPRRRLLPLLAKPKPKEVLRYRPALFSSGSFFDEKMLRKHDNHQLTMLKPCNYVTNLVPSS